MAIKANSSRHSSTHLFFFFLQLILSQGHRKALVHESNPGPLALGGSAERCTTVQLQLWT